VLTSCHGVVQVCIPQCAPDGMQETYHASASFCVLSGHAALTTPCVPLPIPRALCNSVSAVLPPCDAFGEPSLGAGSSEIRWSREVGLARVATLRCYGVTSCRHSVMIVNHSVRNANRGQVLTVNRHISMNYGSNCREAEGVSRKTMGPVPIIAGVHMARIETI
jgi:hypothetical protein